MNWKCKRCGATFDEKLIKKPGCPCDCFVMGFNGPSPWEPVVPFFERVKRWFTSRV